MALVTAIGAFPSSFALGRGITEFLTELLRRAVKKDRMNGIFDGKHEVMIS
jgi:hypothetical protein